MCSGLKPRYAGRGFSLTELLIVVTILGVVAVVAIPQFSSTDPYALDVSANEVAQAMRFARSEAMRTGNPRGFRQEVSAQRIRVFRQDPLDLKTRIHDVYHPLSKKLYDIDFATFPNASVDKINRTVTYSGGGTCNKVANVWFDGAGTARCTDPSDLVLNTFEVSLTLDEHVRTISLDGITGRVTIE